MNSVVCFLWNNGFREYKPEHVNILYRAVRKHCKEKYRFICITDEKHSFDKGIEIIPLPDSAKLASKIPSPEGPRFPSSYRRLWAFSEEAKILGDRILMLDIDCLVVGDLKKLFDYEGDFIGWRPNSVWGKENRIGGGTWLHTTGTLTWVWDEFGQEGITKAHNAGWRGSDQAWISYCLADKYPVFPREIGIYQKQDGVTKSYNVPGNAVIIHYNGDPKPWDMQIKPPWLEQALCQN